MRQWHWQFTYNRRSNMTATFSDRMQGGRTLCRKTFKCCWCCNLIGSHGDRGTRDQSREAPHAAQIRKFARLYKQMNMSQKMCCSQKDFHWLCRKMDSFSGNFMGSVTRSKRGQVFGAIWKIWIGPWTVLCTVQYLNIGLDLSACYKD